jgi:flagellar basal-body rod protein FlgB
MFDGSDFGKTLDLLSRSMDVAIMRRDVIADNIANADVPNFKRSTVNFEASLKKALDSEKTKPELDLVVTNPKHISLSRATDYRSVAPIKVLDYSTSSKNNGNNVDPEQEFMDSLRNQLEYSLLTQATNFEFNQVNTVLKG